jgi:hypothetical protein
MAKESARSRVRRTSQARTRRDRSWTATSSWPCRCRARDDVRAVQGMADILHGILAIQPALPAAEAAKARQKVVVMISRRTGYKALLAPLWQRESRVASRWQSFGCWQLEPGRSALGHGLER